MIDQLSRPNNREEFVLQAITLANAISLARGLLTTLMILTSAREWDFGFAGTNDLWVALMTSVAAGTDKWDGVVATRRGRTWIGARLDQYMDWWLGIGIIYAVYKTEGLTYLNAPFAFAILAYLFLRLLYPTKDSSREAKISSALLTTGGTTILVGHALGSVELSRAGYAVLMVALFFTYRAYRKYSR